MSFKIEFFVVVVLFSVLAFSLGNNLRKMSLVACCQPLMLSCIQY